MRHIKVTQCTLAEGAMTDFVNSVQQWERAAMAHPAAPSHHAVFLDPDEPSKVLVMTQFADKETAAAFEADGLLGRFLEGVMQCAVGTATSRAYDLFYAAGDGGPRAIFGETPHPA